MSTLASNRFRTGEICFVPGVYEFDGYIDGPPEPLPLPSEVEITLDSGDAFPQVHNPNRACYWRLSDENVAFEQFGAEFATDEDASLSA